MRRLLIAGNWKMCKTGREAVAFVEAVRRLLTAQQLEAVEVAICPSFVALTETAHALKGSGIALGAQDLYWEPEGAYTGEVSATMLMAAGCQYVIIGHSERRQSFHETDATVNRKVKAALAAGLTPIMCIGETLEERDRNQTFTVLERQLAQGLAGLSAPQVSQMVMAYEPVWAIGTGRNATSAQADEAHRMIRGWIKEHLGGDAAEHVRLQYGGSVKPENAGELLSLPDVDGALVGGASLDPSSFAAIIEAGRKAVSAHAGGRT